MDTLPTQGLKDASIIYCAQQSDGSADAFVSGCKHTGISNEH
ncbi:hypothetical protein [Pedobacter sp. L105]|nr:hypothetical protein [Pedobacter sp. L105]